MSSTQTRQYQDQAIDSVWQYYINGGTGNPVVALPVATGKSIVIARLSESVLRAYPDQRILMLTHRKELIQQNYNKLLDVWPTAPVGIFSAGLGRRDYVHSIIFAGIASVAKRARLFGRTSLVFIDECHLVSDASNTMYRTFLAGIHEVNPQLKVVGFSATPYRLGVGHITDGGLFTDVCCNMTTREWFSYFVADGFLSPLVPRATHEKMDITGIHMRGGDFVESELAERFALDDRLTRSAFLESSKLASDRKHWLVFATSIEHVDRCVSILRQMGVDARAVHSKMPVAERDKNIEDFRNGLFPVMVNRDILTTGFDAPIIDCIVMLRPTQSPVLWIQMLGRGMRPYPAKPNCLVLDFAGNTARLGPIDDPVLPKKAGMNGHGRPITKTCEACACINHAAARFCIDCGAEFEFRPKYSDIASTAALMLNSNGKPAVQEHEVTRYYATRHKKQGQPDSLRITFESGCKSFYRWVCIEHSGGARRQAESIWRSLAPPGVPVPATVAEGLDFFPHLPVVKRIRVLTSGKYPEIISQEFD